MVKSLSLPSKRNSDVLLTHRLIVGAYQTTPVVVDDLVWSAELVMRTMSSTRIVSNVPAGTVTRSCPVTFPDPEVRKVRPECMFMELPSDRHSLPISSVRTPCRSLGRCFQVPSSIRPQPGSKTIVKGRLS